MNASQSNDPSLWKTFILFTQSFCICVLSRAMFVQQQQQHRGYLRSAPILRDNFCCIPEGRPSFNGFASALGFAVTIGVLSIIGLNQAGNLRLSVANGGNVQQHSQCLPSRPIHSAQSSKMIAGKSNWSSSGPRVHSNKLAA